jgi:hypothetical protein
VLPPFLFPRVGGGSGRSMAVVGSRQSTGLLRRLAFSE